MGLVNSMASVGDGGMEVGIGEIIHSFGSDNRTTHARRIEACSLKNIKPLGPDRCLPYRFCGKLILATDPGNLIFVL